MPTKVIMPALGMAQETGTLLRWLKQEGESVEKGEPLMEIATDKVDVEIEAPASGVLANVTAAEGEEIPVGQIVAFILAPGEPQPPPEGDAVSATRPGLPEEGAAENGRAISPVAARIAAEHNVDLSRIVPAGHRIQKEDVLAYLERQKDSPQRGSPPDPERKEGQKILASPKARRLASERGVALNSIEGSGPEGAVLAADVLAVSLPAGHPPAQTPAPVQPDGAEAPPRVAAEDEIPVSRMWQVMADRLSQSWTGVPHFYLVREVDASRLVAWRRQIQNRSSAGITYTDLMVKLVSVALQQHPRLNACWREGRIVQNEAINVGLAVAVEDGLLVPVLHNAGRLGLFELAAQRAELVQRAQAGRLGPADLQDGTFTISNLGMYGVDAFNAIVNPPQAAILAVGRIADRVVPIDGQPAVRPMLTLTLSCDHRIVDGARAAQFLATLAGLIEEPLRALE